MPNSKLRILIKSIVLSCAVVFTSMAAAQSGRRGTKPAPIPLPTPQATPIPTKPAEKKKAAITFVVAMDEYGGYLRSRSINLGNVLSTVSDRLDDNVTVDVHQVGSSMSRSDVLNRAKSEKEAYVVWIEIKNDSQTASVSTDAALYIRYSVFSPQTAKLKTSGQCYAQAYQRGVVVDPSSRNIYGDYRLQEAAREAAERILRAFQIHVRDKRIPG